MASAKQIAANRANAKKSTGPRTPAGRAKSSRNSYRHGLSLPMQPDAQTVEALAQAIAGETTGEVQLRAARALAEAQLELKRIRATRFAAIPSELDHLLDPRTLTGLYALDRYERQATSRRKAASRWLNEIAVSDNPTGSDSCKIGGLSTERSQFSADANCLVRTDPPSK